MLGTSNKDAGHRRIETKNNDSRAHEDSEENDGENSGEIGEENGEEKETSLMVDN